MKHFKIAVVGNPNSGKTTLFNALTGARQRVGNWPGVTVERIVGEFSRGDVRVEVTDLPGIYSFSAYSLDESVARKHILLGKPDVVVNIVDATNLERNLYLTAQLLEMKAPVVVALNMMDVARKRRIAVDVPHLQRHLDCPVIPIVATKREGMAELREAILAACEERHVSTTRVEYDSELEKAIAAVRAEAAPIAQEHGVDDRWLAIKLMENDEFARELIKGSPVSNTVEAEAKRVARHVGDDIEIVVADGRYGFTHGLARDVVRRETEIRQTVSDGIDRVLLNRAFGVPLFAVVMYLVFMLTINAGAPFIQFFDRLCGTIFVDGVGTLLTAWGWPAWTRTFLADGLGSGIQTVSTFIPPIFFLFLCLSALEDSGYMARAAFVMDRWLRRIGLPGKAFIPMLVGFGCNVPGILATRTLENRRDRLMAVLLNPFMSCGARLPVYTLFAAVFFAHSGGRIVFALYATGIFLAVATGIVFKRTILRGDTSTFVMELPPYHLPTVRGVLYHTWNRLKGFIVRAGRVILVIVVLMTFLNGLGTDWSFGRPDRPDSVLKAVGRRLTPAFRPMGIREDNWPATVGLFTGIFAKESVIGTLDALYAQSRETEAAQAEEPFDFGGGIANAFRAIPEGFFGGEEPAEPSGDAPSLSVEDRLDVEKTTLSEMARRFDGKLGAFAYLLFILIYAPCVAAIAAIYRETSGRWAAFAVAYLTALAWLLSTAFYQAATFARHPGSSALWLGGVGLVLLCVYGALRVAGRRIEVRE